MKQNEMKRNETKNGISVWANGTHFLLLDIFITTAPVMGSFCPQTCYMLVQFRLPVSLVAEAIYENKQTNKQFHSSL